jgi:hypothetical protein
MRGGIQDTFKSGPGSKKVKKGPVSKKRENFYIKFSLKIIFFLKKLGIKARGLIFVPGPKNPLYGPDFNRTNIINFIVSLFVLVIFIKILMILNFFLKPG